jgi:hypothetical protein
MKKRTIFALSLDFYAMPDVDRPGRFMPGVGHALSGDDELECVKEAA